MTSADHVTKTYPLNSKCLTAEILIQIAKGLGLPMNASLAETRHMIEGRLAEEHDPMNVQVGVVESTLGNVLRGEAGLIVELTAEEDARVEREPSCEIRNW